MTIPAQADAKISLIKSLDSDQLAASGKELAGLGNGAAKAAPLSPRRFGEIQDECIPEAQGANNV